MVVESEVLKAQNCALSKLSLPMHSDVEAKLKPRIDVDTMFSLKVAQGPRLHFRRFFARF